MDKQRTLDFHLMSRMNRFVDRVTHLHDSQITMKKVTQISKGVITVTYCFKLLLHFRTKYSLYCIEPWLTWTCTPSVGVFKFMHFSESEQDVWEFKELTYIF